MVASTVGPTKQFPEYHPDINCYVPACEYMADYHFGVARISFGSPAIVTSQSILAASSMTTAGTIARASLLTYLSDARFGRNVLMVASGTCTDTLQLYGRDFYGQPMCEQYTLNNTTTVNGKKAFFSLDRIVYPGESGITLSVNWGTQLGLPVKVTSVIKETQDGVTATAGTLTGPVLTDPQTLTTGDPRGTYVCTTALDAVKEIVILVEADNSKNVTGNGGYMGIQHVNA